MKYLFSFDFWFNLRPGSFSGLSQNIFIVFILLLFFFSFFLYFFRSLFKKENQFLCSSFFYFSLINAFIGSFLLFVNYELIPFFSARFWLILWIIIMITWIIFIFKKKDEYLKKLKQKEKNRNYKKYIP